MSPRLFVFASSILLIFLSCSGGKLSQQSREKELRVMSYNIHHANPPSQQDSIDIPAIVRAIASQQPDLVALQEVDVNTGRSGKGNQAELIAEKLGMYAYFGKALDFDGGEFGTAILSRFPITETITYLLPDKGGKGNEQRILTTARIQLPSGKTIIFGSTHLDHRGDPESRMLQIKELLNLAEEENLPMIVAGDLNARPDSKEIQLLKTEFNLSCTDCPNTFPAEHPDRSIDYIAYSKGFETLSHMVIDEDYASDHRPVMVVLEMKD